ncbi:MAG: ORF6N domain-containing protein [Sulfurimonas sp.]|uniref:ORF6N domain-containing protein n=1 Tax=Sulfurimonas sp. TaxID=2022749 RepID=UPI00263313FB|nr:ORF6N domain-containing protein [Sulfurimonas sp.]MCW8895057.1 ORF6N domain-containing protein [Sulfurimonas sp.]MCW8953611.1 ORF6N domain-containing protein [Sulfurimonas sp.]MCW9068459.1 ORF6N domain-containing protein [Sulfurimonas sp.]
MNEVSIINEDTIKNKIYSIRGFQVMLDRDLAELYGVETKVFNQAVKRNEDRFPFDFRFQLKTAEKDELVTKCDRLNRLKHSSVNPHVFTEQGVSMLSAILKSKIAIDISVKIIRSFVEMRRISNQYAELFQKIENLEKRQILNEYNNDEKFNKLFDAIEDKSIKPKQGIFYDGQVYDAYIFVSDLIKCAKVSIVLIDNYCDDSVLTLLSKRKLHVKANIYTKNITKQLQLDLKKHNTQYEKIELQKFDSSHDRFLIIDEKELYHIGASLKDLGKKWFAFSKFEMNALDMLMKLQK